MAITVINPTSANAWTSGTTITVTVPAPTDGNTLVVQFGATVTTSPTVSSITQTGATWSRASGATNTLRNTETWIAPNVSGAGTTVTINLSANPGAAGVQAAKYFEVTGLGAQTAVQMIDATADNSTSSTSTLTTASITPTAGREAVIFAHVRSGGNYSSGPTGGFTGVTAPDVRTFCGYIIVASTSGSYSTSWTQSGTGNSESTILTLLAPAAGGGGVLFRPYFMGS